MITSHILKFYDLYYGGAEGGALFIEHQSRLQLQKSRFFGYKMLCRSIGRPSIAPPCTRKIAPPFAPPFLRPFIRPSWIAPLVTLKMWVFHKRACRFWSQTSKKEYELAEQNDFVFTSTWLRKVEINNGLHTT